MKKINNKKNYINSGRFCPIDNCSSPCKCEGLCQYHYRQKYIDKYKSYYEKRSREKQKLKHNEYRKKHREELNLKNRQYRALHPEKTKESVRNSSYKRNYGITIAIYDSMLSDQGGVCFICKRGNFKTRLCVDHRHIKGYKKLSAEEKQKEVRGLLCNHCNRVLGWIEHSNYRPRDRLNNIKLYFDKYKIKGD